MLGTDWDMVPQGGPALWGPWPGKAKQQLPQPGWALAQAPQQGRGHLGCPSSELLKVL